MRHKVSVYLDNIITGLIFVVGGLTPLLFLNLTTEFYEMPKLVFLVASVILLFGLWIVSWIIKGKVVVVRTPLDIPLIILLAAVVASAYFSTSQYAAIYGNFPRVHGSAVAWVTYILLYFVTVSHLRSVNRIKMFLYVLYGSAAVVTVLTILSYFRVFLPFDFAQSANFTPTGSSFSTIAFLMLLLPFTLLSIKQPNKYMPLPAALVLSSLFTITIVLIGSVLSYVVLILAFILSFLVHNEQRHKKHFAMYFVPAALMVLTLVLAYVELPNGTNKIQQLQANFPKEIQLPFGISWKVSVSAFRDVPFTGTGPSTYLFDFTNYKPLEFNNLQYWNFAFDTAHNEFLQALATLGAFGVLALLLLSIVVLNSSRKNLSRSSVHHDQAGQHVRDDVSHLMLSAFAVSAILSILLLVIHATTLVSVVITLFVLAIFMASQKSIRDRVTELSLGLRASTADNKQFDLLPVIIFIVFLVGAVPALIRLYNVVAADYYHRLALTQANTNGTKTYEYLQKAETLNPFVDLYRVDMAQTNFALANAIAVQKGPTEDNPQGTLTDEDRRTIQTLLSQAINEARAAVALSPLSARNLEVLAALYRNITGVAQNALAFSLDAYGRAIQRDPLNPALRVNVGGIYFSVRNYDLAIRFFTDAANLKPDYANAYYNLAIAYREKGELQNAQQVAERTVSLLDDNKNSNDYKEALKLLNEIKAKVGDTAAPAAASSSALQNPELGNVEVNELNNPPSVTPAPTVQPNPAANIPQVTPGPTGAQVSPTSAPTTPVQ
jgi:tetratricopeptide (TPR) repeat protein